MVVESTPATADREIVVTRLIEGPRPLVFEAYTDPRHLAHWWGPDGFTTTTRAFEYRPGGVWDFRSLKNKSTAWRPTIPAMVRVQTKEETSTLGAFRWSLPPAYLSRLQKFPLHDGLPGERFVAFPLEQDGDDVVLVAHHQPGSPLFVGHRGLKRKRHIGSIAGHAAVARYRLRLQRTVPRAVVAGIAVAARFREVLAEVSQQELAAAAVSLGVAAHHVEPGLVHPLPRFGELDGALHQCGRFSFGGEPDAPLAGGDGTGVLQLIQEAGHPAGFKAGEDGE